MKAKKQRLWLYREVGFGFCVCRKEPNWGPGLKGFWYSHAEVPATVGLRRRVGKRNMPTEMADLFRIDAKTGKVLKKWEWVE